MHSRLAFLAPILVLAACGRSAPPAAPAEVDTFRAVATTVGSALDAHGDRAASMESATSCREERNEYEERVGPAIERMASLAARIDPWLRERGPSDHADLECVAAALRAEFERHTDIACTSPDLAANRAETLAHVATVARWRNLAVARLEEAGGEGKGTGPRCVRFSDGSVMYLP
jgi:hypothetical protein